MVTGVGVATPYGYDLEAFWSALVEGRSCIGPITRFDASEFPVKICGQLGEIPETPFLPASFIRRNDLYTNAGLLAGGMALEASGLGALSDTKRPVTVIVGSGFGPAQCAEEAYHTFFNRGWRRMNPLTVPRSMFNTLASNLSIQFKLSGGHHTVAAACASGAVAIGEAFLRIRWEQDDVVLAGGADAPVHAAIMGAWANLRVLSKNTDPAKACRPFDLNRDGLVISEGAALMVIEEYAHARQRGAPILGEIVGYGASSDAHHITAPDLDGQVAALRMALKSAGVAPGEVDYINAHGTSTKLNDEVETRSIKAVFGEHARCIPVSSTKSMLGHTMGGAGALELAATLLTIRDGVIAPTINYETTDPECDLDYVPNKARHTGVRVAVKNSFAFGGNNSVLVVKPAPENAA